MRKVRGRPQADPTPIVFPRADPIALAAFDPRTKLCVMNCGQHLNDPRSKKECMLLCEDCHPANLETEPR